MAGHARSRDRRNVHSRQRKAGRAVVKRRSPADRGVASGTLCDRKRIRIRRVRRRVRLLPCRQVALRISAIGRGDLQRIVIVDVAEIAGHVRMPIRQREAKRGMVKLSRRPGRDRVAGSASRSRDGEVCGNVIWNRPSQSLRTEEGGLMAAVAVGRTQRVVVVHMARGAGRRRRRHVRSNQREACRAMVKSCASPTRRGVTIRAVCGGKAWSGGRVHRIIGLLPSGQVALRVPAIPGGDRQVVIVVEMARSAGHVGVPKGERKSRGAVIKGRRVPARWCVTGGTLCNRK